MRGESGRQVGYFGGMWEESYTRRKRALETINESGNGNVDDGRGKRKRGKEKREGRNVGGRVRATAGGAVRVPQAIQERAGERHIV